MKVKDLLFIATIWLWIPFALASSVLGNWTTVDESTGEKRAVVCFRGAGNTVYGTIEHTFKKPGEPEKCQHCSGAFKDKPIKGLAFIWGFVSKTKDTWTGGRILDPSTGRIYRASMWLRGDKLVVRGYLGVSLLGRTQVWVR